MDAEILDIDELRTRRQSSREEIQKYLDEHADDDVLRRLVYEAIIMVGGSAYFARQAISNPKSFMATVTKMLASGPSVQINTQQNNTQVQVYMPDNGRGAPPVIEGEAKTIPDFLGDMPATPLAHSNWDIDKEGSEVL